MKSFPRAGEIEEVKYQDTGHYQITRDFLACPERFLKHLFSDPPEE